MGAQEVVRERAAAIRSANAAVARLKPVWQNPPALEAALKAAEAAARHRALPAHWARKELADLAAERGVRVVPGRAFDLDGAPSRGVRLSLTRATADEIHVGVRVLGECASELLQLQPSAQPFI